MKILPLQCVFPDFDPGTDKNEIKFLVEKIKEKNEKLRLTFPILFMEVGSLDTLETLFEHVKSSAIRSSKGFRGTGFISSGLNIIEIES